MASDTRVWSNMPDHFFLREFYPYECNKQKLSHTHNKQANKKTHFDNVEWKRNLQLKHWSQIICWIIYACDTLLLGNGIEIDNLFCYYFPRFELSFSLFDVCMLFV